MPYPFAHVAAAVPLRMMLGRRGVPSALAIGSIAPDLWYFVPLMEREHAHSLAGLLWFCLPVSLFLYLAFHLLFKQPLLDLAPASIGRRLNHWSCPGLPPVSWGAVVGSFVAGTLVHLVWDALTHPGLPALTGRVLVAGHLIYWHQIFQHSSTMLGSLFLAWWIWRKCSTAPAGQRCFVQPVATRIRAMAGLAILVPASVASLVVMVEIWPSSVADFSAWRLLFRAAATTGLSVLGFGLVTYCALWRLTCGREFRVRPGRTGLRGHRRQVIR